MRRISNGIVKQPILTYLVASWIAIVAPCRAAADQEPFQYAYLFGHYGEFVKVDLENLTVAAYWALPRVEGVASISPPDQRGANTATGWWIPWSVQYDPGNRRHRRPADGPLISSLWKTCRKPVTKKLRNRGRHSVGHKR